MTTTYRVGAGNSGGAYISYLLSKATTAGQENLDSAARYYAAREEQNETLSRVDELGLAIHRGEVGFDEALEELIQVEVLSNPAGVDREAIAHDLSEAATRADFREAGILLGSSGAVLRPDIDPDLAKRLEIDTSRPLTVREMTHLMDNRTALGNDIEGKKKHSAHRSVAETFGLDEKALPSVAEISNVLAGKRSDGKVPVDEAGKPISSATVDSSVRKFRSAIGVPASRDTTTDEIQNVADGRINVTEYHRKIAATSPPVGYVDIVWSADKSVSSAWALAPTDAEADLIRSWVRDAAATQMAYLEKKIAVARSGAGGKGQSEAAKMAWVSTEHVDARPTVDVVRLDALGRAFTETMDIPSPRFDPQLHVHNPTFASILTDTGRVSSVNLDLLDGEVKVAGAIGHAKLATIARRNGAHVTLGPNGEARLSSVPEWLRKFHSRRTIEGTDAAKEYAQANGKDWDQLSPEEQIRLLDRGTASKRRDKDGPEAGVSQVSRAGWVEDAGRAGYRHRSVLRPDEIEPEFTPEQRIRIARHAALPLLDKALQGRAVLTQSVVREIAARGLIVSGIGDDPEADIEAVVKTFRQEGVLVDGKITNLIVVTTHGQRGRLEQMVTTGATVALEETVLAEVKRAAMDHSTALNTAAIERAIGRFLAAHPAVDKDGEQWETQREMIHRIGTGARVSLSIGVAGSGKTSSVIGTLVDAWHKEGRTVYGMTVPWKSSAALRDAGVDQALAIDAFLFRVRAGKIEVDATSVIVADEVSQIGVRHQVELLELAARTGAQLVEIGDPRQCQAVETPGIELMAKAIGDEQIPKLLTTIRQRSKRDREVAAMFRNGQAADGIASLQEDDRFHLVAGDQAATVRHTTDLWRKLTDAGRDDPAHTVLVMTDTNAHALEIGRDIRANRRAAGEIGRDEITLKAMDPNSGELFDLPVAKGDRLRLFTRVSDADDPDRKKQHLGSHGDVVEVREVLHDSLRIRNSDGVDGRVTWAQMKPWRAPVNDPVRVTMGMAVTVDSAQSMTKTTAIYALPAGSANATGYKSYTAMSRHQAEAHIVVSDAAERKAISKRQMLGVDSKISQEDVVRNIATNLSKFAEKRYATDLIRTAVDVQRGTIRAKYAGDAQQHETCRPGATEKQREAPEAPIASADQSPEPIKRIRQAPAETPPEEKPAQQPQPRPPIKSQKSTPPRRETSSREHVDVHSEFAEALRREGFQLKGAPAMDGRWHRERVEGDRPTEKSGRYRAFVDGRPAGFIQNFKAGSDGVKWMSGNATAGMSDADRQRQDHNRAARETERLAAENKAAVRAVRLWAASKPVQADHAYLVRKGVMAHEIRQDRRGNLIVPLRDAAGTIRNAQVVTPDGDKRFLTGGRKEGLMVQIGEITPDRPLLIAEGYATAATLYEITGLPVVVAFDAGNLMPVARAIREARPDQPIVFAADNDHHLPRREKPQANVGLVKAAAAAKAVDGKVIVPRFGDLETGTLEKGAKPPTDWNDFAAMHDRKETRQELRLQLESSGMLKATAAANAAKSTVLTQAARDAARQTNATSQEVQIRQTAQNAARQQQTIQPRRGPRV